MRGLRPRVNKEQGRRQATALAVGGRRPPLPACAPPTQAAGPAQCELDLVPWSGYGALSARAASLKQLASKNTLCWGVGDVASRPASAPPPSLAGWGFLRPVLGHRLRLG